MPTEEKIVEIVQAHGISPTGFVIGDGEELQESSNLLQPSPETISQIAVARPWLARFIRRSTINRNVTAEMLRVRIEAETGSQVSLGAVLVACVLEGIMIRRTSAHERDAFTNLSLKLAGT